MFPVQQQIHSLLQNKQVEFDPNPSQSEVIVQKIVESNGVQHVVQKVETMYPNYNEWLQKDDSKKVFTKKEKTAKVRALPGQTSAAIDSQPFRCAALEFEITCAGSRKRAHIITRQIQQIKADTINVLAICEAHERFFNKRGLKYWYEYVKEYHPTNFHYVLGKVKFIKDEIAEYLEVAGE